MKLTHTQASLVAEEVTPSEVDDLVTRFVELYQQEPVLSIQGPATPLSTDVADARIEQHPLTVYRTRPDAVEVDYEGARLWVTPAEGRWERVVLTLHQPDASPSTQQSDLPIDAETLELIDTLLDEIDGGSEHVYTVSQRVLDAAGVQGVLLFFKERRTAKLLITATTPQEHECAQRSEVGDEEDEL